MRMDSYLPGYTFRGAVPRSRGDSYDTGHWAPPAASIEAPTELIRNDGSLLYCVCGGSVETHLHPHTHLESSEGRGERRMSEMVPCLVGLLPQEPPRIRHTATAVRAARRPSAPPQGAPGVG